MEVNVRMSAEEFLEFAEYQRNKAMYAEKLSKMQKLPRSMAAVLGFAVEPDEKRPGKFKIISQEHMADLWDMAGEITE